MLGRSHENKKLYQRILFSIILCIVITLLVTSTILYFNFNAIALKQVYRSDSSSLEQTSQEISKIAKTATSLSFQIYRDFTITDLLFYEHPDIFNINMALMQLNNYRLSLEFIDSIYVYSTKSDRFFVSSNNFQAGTQTRAELGDQSIIDILDHFQDYSPFLPIPRTYMLGIKEQKKVNSYSVVIYDAINTNNSLESAVVVNISDAWLNRNIGNKAKDSTSGEFIINQEGQLLSTHGKDSMMTDYSHKGYIKKILLDADSSGYIVDSVDSVKSLVSYTAPDSIGWRYVKVTSYNEITKEVRSMRNKTISISLGILLIGLLLSIFTSKKLYRPIDKVLDRIRALEVEQRNSLQILKQDFLRNVILGREAYTTKTLQEKLNYYGSRINIYNKSQLVLLKIDHFAVFLDKYKDEINIFRYAMMNISSEISSNYINVEAIDMGDDQVLLLLSARDNEQIPDEETLMKLIQSFQTSILEYLKLSVSITASPVCDTLEMTISLYKQVIEASYHRLFKGHGSVIFSEQIMNLKLKKYTFPLNKEKHLAECLIIGKASEAQKIYSEIVSEAAEFPYSVIQLVISHLMLTIDTVINTIKKNNALTIQLGIESTIISLNQVESIGEINQQFLELFEELKRTLVDKRNIKYEDLIKKMNTIIERDYANPDLCLNSIAEEMHMSPNYFSRLYKNQSSIALSDIIQDVRLNKSKVLLKETSLSVADIAEKTGFSSSSYFYRIFKKFNGITPNEFRNQLI